MGAGQRRRGRRPRRLRGSPVGLNPLDMLVDTFFDGSAEQVVAAVLGGEGSRLKDKELDRIAELVAKAKKEGAR
jgi:hypothetical protein